jgi:hypothetical protein
VLLNVVKEVPQVQLYAYQSGQYRRTFPLQLRADVNASHIDVVASSSSPFILILQPSVIRRRVALDVFDARSCAHVAHSNEHIEGYDGLKCVYPLDTRFVFCLAEDFHNVYSLFFHIVDMNSATSRKQCSDMVRYYLHDLIPNQILWTPSGLLIICDDKRVSLWR